MVSALITNIGLLATPKSTRVHRGAYQGRVQYIRNAAIAISNGYIHYVGDMANAPTNVGHIIDAEGCLVTPGLVDAHTHAVFGGFRQNELALKLAGKSYMEILQAGGGIHSTVEATRAAPRRVLHEKSAAFLQDMLNHGTTTAEIKTGYGLNYETEMKQLSIIKSLQKDFHVVSTFMGAHAIPSDFNDRVFPYEREVMRNMIPAVAKYKLADFCDVFCEESVFDIKQSRQILETAKHYGLGIKIHADEITAMGAAGLAAELGAISAEHLLETSDEDLKKMADAGVIAVLLPATSFYLNKNYARARTMIDMGIPVALGTDFNPGSSPNYNMQFVLNLACLKLKLTPEEALIAATINATHAIGSPKHTGCIRKGHYANIVIWDCPDLDFLCYRYGNNQVREVFTFKQWRRYHANQPKFKRFR
ncbi:MAG: imidazolonepropionase [Defluviitaleaceae bacterium]|nr:imidazolonepropionase [Defluviitaleaceae bacterium]MCL2273932.1 imidazolonepropionase [Defluviitaleaceae bacterium]